MLYSTFYDVCHVGYGYIYNAVIFPHVSDMYRAPDVQDKDVTPEFVRDELLVCFESANGEFARLMNQPITDEALKQQVKDFIVSTFASCGAKFENPTKQGIILAISQCKGNAEKMMGPKGAEIIQHHYDEMMKLVNRLTD